MALPLQQWRAWDVLRRRFSATQPGRIESPGLLTDVRPILDFDRANDEVDNLQTTTSITGTGPVVISNTVPVGMEWEAYAITIQRTGGTWTFNDVRLRDSDGQDLIYAIGSSVTFRLWEHPQPMLMRTGWSYAINVDAHSVTGNCQSILHYRRRMYRI